MKRLSLTCLLAKDAEMCPINVDGNRIRYGYIKGTCAVDEYTATVKMVYQRSLCN